MVELLAFGSGFGFGISLIQDIITSNAETWLSNATLRYFSLGEQCNTQNFYLCCFKSDFKDVKANLVYLLSRLKKRPTQNRNHLKNEDDLKMDDNLKRKITSKMRNTSKMKITSKMKMTSKLKTSKWRQPQKLS